MHKPLCDNGFHQLFPKNEGRTVFVLPSLLRSNQKLSPYMSEKVVTSSVKAQGHSVPKTSETMDVAVSTLNDWKHRAGIRHSCRYRPDKSGQNPAPGRARSLIMKYFHPDRLSVSGQLR